MVNQRVLDNREKEHDRAIRNEDPEASTITAHCLQWI
jgi:hypothetical protein